MLNILIYICIIVIILVSCLIVRHSQNKFYFSFKETLDLTGLPIITIRTTNGMKLNMLVDTGSSKSHINKSFIENHNIDFEYTDEESNVFGMDGKVRTTKSATMIINIKDEKYLLSFIINDLSEAFGHIKEEFGVTLHGILGNDFFERYKYIIDYNKWVAYPNN